jgi:hypothetical protein
VALIFGWLMWADWGIGPLAAVPKDGGEGKDMGAATRVARTARPPIDEGIPATLETATFALG